MQIVHRLPVSVPNAVVAVRMLEGAATVERCLALTAREKKRHSILFKRNNTT
jgi:hypothetical protein